jgi:hypothetical protein
VATQQRTAGLHECLQCPSELVHPVQWELTGPRSWSVLLRCPECEVYRTGVFDQETMDAFDRELDRAEDLLRAAYVQLAADNMSEETRRFSRALAADAILPEDF